MVRIVKQIISIKDKRGLLNRLGELPCIQRSGVFSQHEASQARWTTTMDMLSSE